MVIDCIDALVRAWIDEYREADHFALGVPEFRSNVDGYQETWRLLDDRYAVTTCTTIEDMTRQASSRAGERGISEVEGDIQMLGFLEKLFHERKLLDRTARPDASILLTEMCPELFGVLGKVFPEFGFMGAPDCYSAAASARSIRELANLKTLRGPKIVILTLNDDNIAYLPQHVAKPIESLVRAIQQFGLDGFVVRYWLSSDLDPGAAYLARASWAPDASPTCVLGERVRRLCGDPAMPAAMRAFDLLDDLTDYATLSTPWGFPVPALMANYFNGADVGKSLDVIARCIQTWPSRFVGVAYVDWLEDRDLRSSLSALKRLGFRGIRLPAMARCAGDDELRIWREAHRLDLHISAQGGRSPAFWATGLPPVLDSLPDLSIRIEHLARPRPGIDPYSEEFRRVLEMAKYPNVVINIDDLCVVSKAGPPYDDVWPCVEAVLTAFGPERVMWGSDVPYIFEYQSFDASYRDILARLVASGHAAHIEMFAFANARRFWQIA